MRITLQYLSWLLWFPLDLLVIATLLRGAYRRYPFVFAYSVTLFFTTAVEVAAYTSYFAGTRLSHSRAVYYWIDEGIRQALLFGVVINLLYLASSGVRARGLVRTSLIAGAVLFAGVSFLVHYDSTAAISKWMTLWVRDLSFSSAILDFALWTLLLSGRRNDVQLFLLSGGLGIQFAGEAIGQTLRNQFPALVLGGNILIIATSLACPYVWWQALRTVPHRKKASVQARSPNS
jgi:hypothetical protein